MIYFAWILFLGLMTFVFDRYLDRQTNPNQQVETQQQADFSEVKLIRNRYGHYVVSGEINTKAVTFLLDTGATLISIPANLAHQLKLKKGYPSQSRTANGTITVFATQLDTVSIGAITLHNIRATINPHMEGDEILLGMNFMKHLEMTQKGNELTLRY